MITSNIIHNFVVFISKSKQYFNWEIDVKNDLRVNHIEWTINLSIKSTFIVEFLHNRNIDWNLIEAKAKVKITDLIVVVEKHERDLNKFLFYLFNAMNFNHRSFIIVIVNSTSLIYWTKIAERFKKNIFVLLVDIIFDLIDRIVTLTNVEFYIKIVESLHNQLITENADSKLTVDVLCQDILLFKMHKLAHLNYFVTRQRDEWIFENTNLIEIETFLLNFIKVIIDTIAESDSTALIVDRSEELKRTRFNVIRFKYIDSHCINQKCIDNDLIKHASEKCYFQHSEIALKRWIDKNMSDHSYDKTLKKTQNSQ